MKAFNNSTTMPLLTTSNSVKETTTPLILQDSKSSVNLCEDAKKIRQGVLIPTVTKNSERQFLRYTVHLNKTDFDAYSSVNSQPPHRFKLQRKFTIPDTQKHQQHSYQPHLGISKPTNLYRKTQKKNTNPEGKDDMINKFPIPKFLQVKTQGNVEDTKIRKQNKTQKILKYTPSNPNQQKQLTQSNNHIIIDDPKSPKKILPSNSSTDLHKLSNINQSSQQLTSSSFSKQKLIQYPSIIHFKKLKFLGEGKFGQVHLVLHKQTNLIFALKQIKKDNIFKNKMESQLLMEIKMQFYFQHPNILKLYGIFKDQENVYLILQYMEEGTLYSQLRKKKIFTQEQASRKLRDVLESVKHLHSQNIAHRDIKPQNIVISNDVCKICDLGWAAICQDRRKTLCGTIDYASPQLLQGKEYGIAIDLWCLGILCFQLMVGKCPFYHISRKQTMKKIINADLSDINIPNNLSNEAKYFIGKLIRKNPEERMSAEQALQHPFITKYIEEDLDDTRNSNKKKN